MSRNYDSVMRIALSCKEPLWSDALVALLSANQSCEVVAVELDTRSLITAAKDQYAQALVIDSTKLDQSDLQFLLGARAFGDFEIILIIQEDELEMYQGIPVDRIVTRVQSAKSLYDALGAVSTPLKLRRPLVREGRKPYGSKEDNVLSRREYEVALLVAKGMSNRRISVQTGLREQSVKNLVSVVMRKLHCENRVQVALKLVNAPVAEVED